MKVPLVIYDGTNYSRFAILLPGSSLCRRGYSLAGLTPAMSGSVRPFANVYSMCTG